MRLTKLTFEFGDFQGVGAGVLRDTVKRLAASSIEAHPADIPRPFEAWLLLTL